MVLAARNTKIKKQITGIFGEVKYPISAAEILSKVKANKTTVYREISSFISDGLVREIDFGDGKKRYELVSRGHHHHLICSKCKKVDDIVLDEDPILSKVEKLSKFKIESHSLEFFGLCSNCQKI